MVEDELTGRLQRIFQMKVTLDKPSESREQQCVFADVKNSHVNFYDKRQIARLEGVITIFANREKMPIGFISKMIREAAIEDIRPFFFGPEQSAGTYLNITERSVEFTFLFDSQYDPSVGTLNSINLSTSET